MVLELRDFIFGCGGKASTQAIVDNFKLSIKGEDAPVFRTMLKKIADFDKKGRKMKNAKRMAIDVGAKQLDDSAVEDAPARILRGDRDGRYTSDRKIRGSGGRKGRKNRPAYVEDE